MENKTLASAHKPIKVLDGTVMWIICAVVIVLFYALGFSGVLSNNNMRYLFKIFLYITMGSMWNLMSGYTGMTSLGQQTFIGIAGYALTVVTATYGLFTEGLDKFQKAVDDGVIAGVLSTNLTYRTPELLAKDWFTEVDCSKYIAYYILALHQNQSVSKLLDPHKKIDALLARYKKEQSEN